MLFITTCLLLLIQLANTMPTPTNAFFSTSTTTILLPSSKEKHITVGYLSVSFDQKIQVKRDAIQVQSNNILYNNNEYPELNNKHHMYGLSRFVCKKDKNSNNEYDNTGNNNDDLIIFTADQKVPTSSSSQPTGKPDPNPNPNPNPNNNDDLIIFTTDQTVPTASSAIPTGILYPLSEIEQHATSWLVSSIARENFDASRYSLTTGNNPSSFESRYDAVYFWQDNNNTSSPPAPKNTNNNNNNIHPNDILALVKKGNCNIEFLSKSQQTWVPKGSLVSKDGGGTGYFGSVLIKDWKNDDVNRPWPRVEIMKEYYSSRVITTNAITRVSQQEQEQEQYHRQQHQQHQQPQPQQSHSQSFHKEKDCIPLPPGLTDYANEMVLLESTSTSTSTSTSKLQGIAEDLPKLIKEPVSDILKPITKLMGGFLGETLIEPFKEQMGQMTSAGMTAGIVEDLSSAMINSLSKGIPATTLETIPGVVIEGLAESLMLYVTEQVTTELVGPLSSKLAASLGSTVPKKVDGDVPKKLASHVTKSLIHVLTRSVSHAVVPSLVHTLTHSPLQDYYCYYCFHHKTYCQYCQYSPSQLFYALYYTGFYSTYYGDYYADT